MDNCHQVLRLSPKRGAKWCRDRETIEQGPREQGNRDYRTGTRDVGTRDGEPDSAQGSGLVVGRFVSVVKDRMFRWLCRSVNGLGLQ